MSKHKTISKNKDLQCMKSVTTDALIAVVS